MANLLFLISVSHGASGQFLHQIWRSEDGLPNPAVRALLQTREGYLWLATDESVVRFDGARFVEFDQQVFDRQFEPRKTDRWRVALIESRDGSVWTSSINGGISRIKDGTVTRFTMAEGLLHDYVLSARQDSRGNIWVGTAAGLSCFVNDRFVNYTNHPGLIVEAVRDILEDHDGALWIGTAKGLSCLRDGRFTSYTTNDMLVNNAVMSLFQDRSGVLWIGTSGGLTRFAKGNATHFTTADGLAHNSVRSVFEDLSGNIWIGTQGGLQQYRDGAIRNVNIRSLDDPDFEGVSFVYALCEDREGNLWIGTNLGLHLVQAQKFIAYAREDGLSHNTATSVFEDQAGNVWIGTYGGGLCSLREGKFQCWTTEQGLSSNFILGLAGDRDGNIWVGTEARGVNRLRDGKFTQFVVSDEPRANTVRALLEDSRGRLWVGSNNGLFYWEGGRFLREERIAATEIKAIMESRDGSVLVAAKPGLTKLMEKNAVSFRIEEGLSSDVVNVVHEDAEGVLWVGNNFGGLNRIGLDGMISGFRKIEGPFNEHVVQITEDQYANLWLGTRNGVFRVSKKELNDFSNRKIPDVSFVSFGRNDGMRRAQCNGIAQPSGVKTRDNKVWFPTLHGVVVFDPNEAGKNPLLPPVLIEEVLLDGDTVPTAIDPRLPPSDGEVEFRYTALSFRAPEKVRFKYQLEGVDHEWRDAGTRRSARYTNLRPGDYRFVVKACNNDGLWNETGAVFAFTLAPHIYQMMWFYVACGAVMIFAGAAVNLMRLRRARVREKELLEMVESKTSKLQQAITSMETFNYSIAHDLRAPLRAIKGLTGALTEDYANAFDATAKDYSDRIRQAVDRMDKLITDLLTFGRITHKDVAYSSVNTEELMAKVLRDLDPEIARQKAVVKLQQPLPRMWGNETLLEQALINLVTNALKFVPPGVTPFIEIRGVETESATRLIVRDNGIGIDAAHQKRIFGVFERLHSEEAYPGTGIGLAIVQKAIERLDGTVGVESKPGEGSSFWIELPRRKTVA